MISSNAPVKFASFVKRAAAFAVDAAIAVAVYGLLIYLVNRLLALPVEYTPFLERGLSLTISPYVREHFAELVALYSLLKLAVLFPYFAVLESSPLQATVGKWLLGIKVTDLTGKRISFARAAARFFAKILSGQFLLIGYFIAAFTEKSQALHDLLAATLVVNGTSMALRSEAKLNP